MTKKKIRLRREVKIGMFAVAMILLLYWAVNFIKGTDLIKGTSTYYATYGQVTGLQPSSPIVIRGYKVGVVQRMYFNPAISDNILIELRIKSRFKIPDDSKARIFSEGLMGGKAVEIVLGESERHLHKGDTLHTEWDKDFLEMAGSEIDYLMGKINALVTQTTGTLQQIEGLVSDNRENLGATMGHLSSMSASLDYVITSEAEDLKGVIDNMNSLSSTLAAAGPRMDGAITNLEAFSRTLNSPGIPEAIDRLSSGLAEFDSMMKGVNAGEGTLGRLMNDEALYDSLTTASANLARLLEDIKSNPKRYVHFSVFGGGKNK